MKSLGLSVAVLVLVLFNLQASQAVNLVEIESKNVTAGTAGVPIGIRLTNDVAVRTVVVPLAVREVTSGAFITSLEMAFAERLTSSTVLDVRVRNQYADEIGVSCPAGGFGTVTHSDGGPHPVVAAPEGILIAGTRTFGSDLPPGGDATGSLMLTVNVSSTAGTFEIDTVCIDPANHLGFWNASNQLMAPEFTKGIITIQPAICFQTSSGPYPVGVDPRAIVCTDLDGDGDRDLAVANWGSDNLSIYHNDGNGTFAFATNIPALDASSCVEAGDLDGDGDIDLITVEQATSPTGWVGVFLNTGGGAFAPPVWYQVQDQPKWVSLGYLNADSRLDLVVANSYSDNVSILINNGSGGFGAPPYPTYGVGDQPVSVVIADLDLDGDNDVVTANATSNNVSVLKNTGNGTFSAVSNYAAGLFPQSVIATRLNPDPSPDLAVTNLLSGQVTILRNWGDGSFFTYGSYPTQSNPASLCSADMDGDGATDLAVTNYGSGSVSVLRNTGLGAFETPINYAVGSLPFGIVAEYLDDDGTFDLAVTSIGSDNVSVLLSCALTSSPGYTPTGSDITMSLESGVTVTFANVTTPGQTSVVYSESGPQAPGSFEIMGMQDGYLMIQTTCQFSGPILVCLPYNDYDLPWPEVESLLELFHYIATGDVFLWDRITTSRDMENNIICGQVTSLSPFLLATPSCSCQSQSDLDGNDFIDAVDLAVVIDVVFFGASDYWDPACPASRADFNNDGFADAVDLASLIDHVFFGGTGPVSPCTL